MRIVPVSKIPKVADVVDVPGDLPLVYKTCQEMAILCKKSLGIGLSAVQVGIPWRLFLVYGDGCPLVPKGEFGYFVNCEYNPINEDTTSSLEGCLSLTALNGESRMFEVKRFKNVKVAGFKLLDDGELRLEKVDEILDVDQQGIVFQHEIDHHFGILISDIGKEMFIWR